jgi:beta-phosphoglucomutase
VPVGEELPDRDSAGGEGAAPAAKAFDAEPAPGPFPVRAAIFDLDGVVVDTAKYHFLGWKRLADEMGVPFSSEDNERLKGVSRAESLEIILRLGNLERTEAEKVALAAKKNDWYLEYIDAITPDELLPDVLGLLEALHSAGVALALASASKNAPHILAKLGIAELFDVVVDGNSVATAKPDPEIFLTAAQRLGVAPQRCAVFEDALAGVEAGRRAGMFVVGVGRREVLVDADIVVNGFTELDRSLFTGTATPPSMLVEDSGYDPGRAEFNGSRFVLCNGYMGYRGTLDEHRAAEQVACTLAGLYDQVGDAWREPVNAPNGLFTRVRAGGQELSVLTVTPASHRQVLDMSRAVHKRRTSFQVGGAAVEIASQRFVSQVDVHLAAAEHRVRTGDAVDIVIETGVDGEVWDINGPHLHDLEATAEGGCTLVTAVTTEGVRVAVATATDLGFHGEPVTVLAPASALYRLDLLMRAGEEVVFHSYMAVFSDKDGVGDVAEAALSAARAARAAGYGRAEARHRQAWRERWLQSDVEVGGDDKAQLALRYSLFQLMQLAPAHTEHASIPGRGLSGQMYKGAVFWDTEVFCLPFFVYNHPDVARKLIKYRVHALDGARRKAAEYGFKGAYFAWESQDNGDDACTLFNVTDVFTNRPLRTYFRDKQVHISADVAYAIWQYCVVTGDYSVLYEGGAEVLVECARFYCSWAYFKKDKHRYELVDVTGPDEYHERVANNAYTNAMARHCVRLALKVLERARTERPDYYADLVARLGLEAELVDLQELAELLYVPAPAAGNLVIEQFDGYLRLEHLSLEELKSRILAPAEYLGGGAGLATNTQVLKQADVVALMALFAADYPPEVKRANWEFYEERTEQGSTLSASLYATVAAHVGLTDRAYDYFMNTATVDLAGTYKRYVGSLYIGGTHPGASGGAWMTVVHGFAGFYSDGTRASVRPALPSHWDRLTFNAVLQGQRARVEVTHGQVTITAAPANDRELLFDVAGQLLACGPGLALVVPLPGGDRDD